MVLGLPDGDHVQVHDGVFFLTLGAVAFAAARARLVQGSRLWGASLDELERDKERLRP